MRGEMGYPMFWLILQTETKRDQSFGSEKKTVVPTYVPDRLAGSTYLKVELPAVIVRLPAENVDPRVRYVIDLEGESTGTTV